MDINHFNISIIKSFIRIFGYCWLLSNMYIAVFILLLSEVLGIVEELVEEY